MDARPDRASQLQAAIQRWGTLARAATPGDAGGQLAPWVVIEPEDAATVAAVLQWADTDGLAVIPRGGGTAPNWTAATGRVDVILSTSRLTSGLDHCAGDLTAVAPAGVTIDALNAALGREGQWLPLDPPDGDRSTVGGVLATNASGPRRHEIGRAHV